ncbi:MAG: HAD family hydrolase [Lacisediminihabitans sp.]
MTSVIDHHATVARESPAFSVVLFDLDDTLFAHNSSALTGLNSYRALLGTPFADQDEISAARHWQHLEDEHYRRYLSGELSYTEQRRERAKGFAAQHGMTLDDGEADAWYNGYFAEYEKAWMLYGDALACLSELASAGVRLGIITNGDLTFQTNKIERLGLLPLFEYVVTSGELGYAKPDARIYEHACSLFGIEASRAAYVGDRLRTDAIGAAGAGLTGVWLDRHGAATVTEIMAARASGVPIIRTLAELPAAIGVHA